jgi:hypothetical protein
MVPISVQLYSLREQMKDGQHAAVLKKLGEIGFRGLNPPASMASSPTNSANWPRTTAW